MSDRQLQILLIIELPVILAAMVWFFFRVRRMKKELRHLASQVNEAKNKIEADLKEFQGFSDELEKDIDEMTDLEKQMCEKLDENAAFMKRIVENGITALSKLKEEVKEQGAGSKEQGDDKDLKDSENVAVEEVVIFSGEA